MKIKANNANSPIWKDVYSHSKLPQQLEPLNEIATNLWWVWNHEGAKLFGKIDKQLWKSTEGNPVQLLQSLSHKRMEEILADKELMAEIQKVYADFKAYINVKPDKTQPSVAYFSMEYGLTNVLKIYSGGLGVLAGDYLKEASDSNIDLCAVGFLYRYGYFTQTLSMDGQQIANYEPQNFNALPLTQVLQSNGEPMVLEVPYPGRTVYAHIWKVSVGRVPLYLMDTDIPQNSEWDRSITHQLYGGDWENRMKQEYLLGIGGIMMLNKLGIKKQIYHCNEGHAALINAQRLVDYIQNDGLSFNQALEVVRASALYTVHTPVPAGHDYFDEGLFGRYMGEFPGKLGISWQDFIDMGRENPGSNEKFSMSVFAVNAELPRLTVAPAPIPTSPRAVTVESTAVSDVFASAPATSSTVPVAFRYKRLTFSVEPPSKVTEAFPFATPETVSLVEPSVKEYALMWFKTAPFINAIAAVSALSLL